MSKKRDMEKLIQIAKDIDSKGGTVYFVGGFVRDKLLGKQNKDIDVEIHNISVEDTKHILEKYGYVSEVGASFGILMLKGLDIDFAFPRTEKKVGDKHTDFIVDVDPFVGVESAVKRRDFTMNSVMQNVLTGEFVDIYGGIKDIENKTIRYVDKDTFIEDSLRPLRACQFASRLGFTVDRDVIELSKKLDYSNLSKERIVTELDKALLSDKPSIAFNYLKELGILEKIFPELFELIGCEQNPEFHPEGDVWNHTMLVIDEGSKIKNQSKNPRFFMYACLLHDIGKPPTTKRDSNNILRSFGHDVVGADMAKQFIKKNINENALEKYVYKLTLYHMKAHKLLEINDYKVKKIMLDVDTHELLLLNYCDISGREVGAKVSKRKSEFNLRKNKIEEFSNGDFGVIEPYITGKFLLDNGLKQGKEIGTYLNKMFDLQLQGKSEQELKELVLNKINKKEKVNPEVILEQAYLKVIKENAFKKEKQIKIYNRFFLITNKLNEQNKTRIKLSKTKQMNMPYLISIMKEENNIYKIIFFPDIILKFDVRFSKFDVLLDHYEQNSTTRDIVFEKVIKNCNINDLQKELFRKSYSKLNTKI